MPDPDLRIGTFRYDTTQALFDGTAEIPGVPNVAMATGATLPEVFRLLLDGENAELMTEDWWPYGVAANRTALDTLLRYHHEQGLTAHRWRIEEIFTPDLLET
ncbi:hypothetical protein [Streptomyces sp. PSAA01]|uniref:hypothetical protein n=1 Tax=Streptomyces sp. PSAA01 TaxID=2912762 RepID=UPI001F3C9419|nr:hypothetical protein [Streptomyces sp. PSAA01]MCG0285777.1 hypothetical protein [Streptomyces sp. PSAA01]